LSALAAEVYARMCDRPVPDLEERRLHRIREVLAGRHAGAEVHGYALDRGTSVS